MIQSNTLTPDIIQMLVSSSTAERIEQVSSTETVQFF